MARIAVILDTNEPTVIPVLRRSTGESVAVLRSRIAKREPVGEYLLFMNDHDEVTGRLLGLLDALVQERVPMSLYELKDDERLDEVHDLERRRVTREYVEKMVARHDAEVARFLGEDPE